MASTVDAFMEAMTQLRPMTADAALTGDSNDDQANAWPIRSALSVVVKGDTGAGLILPSLISNEAGAGMYVVVNKSSTSVQVFAAVGDTMNTVANAAVTIAAAGAGIFVKKKATAYPYVAPDWSGAAFT